MMIERTEHPDWLTNAYLLAEQPGGYGVLIDANDVLDPLLERVEEDQISITHILLTHHHPDHVAGLDRYKEQFDVPVVAHAETASVLGAGVVDEIIDDGGIISCGGLRIRAIYTPGHCLGHVALLVGEDCFTADVLFNGTVGGTQPPSADGDYESLRHSVMERLMKLPPDTRVHPGHRDPTTIGKEWETNPFIRVWRGIDPETDLPCKVKGEPATLLLWADDYDGGNKALVRFPSGEVDIAYGSKVER
jgi:glyoxylase-like metal-dependent hydrolase (beta-lactamase superfamily II)